MRAVTSTSDQGYTAGRNEARPAEPDRLGLFVTPVWRWQIAADRVDRRDLEEMVTGWAAQEPSRDRSNEGGWQSDTDVAERPGAEALVTAVEACARVAAVDLGLDADRLHVTSCWANVNGRGDANRMHLHGDATLSAVFYVRAEPGHGRVVFLDPRHAALVGPRPLTPNALNSAEVGVEVASGDLVVFPGWLLHRVEPSRLDEPRVSIALNLSVR